MIAFSHIANHFMTEDHRHFDGETADFALLVIVQIGAADAAARNAHQRAFAVPLHLLLRDADLVFARDNAGLRFDIHNVPIQYGCDGGYHSGIAAAKL